MKIICLEEHLATTAIIAAWQELDPATRDISIAPSRGDTERRLRGLADGRVAPWTRPGSTYP